jgi:hypothetical protein
MTRHPDPTVRRILAYERAQARTKRRVAALLDYVGTGPLRPTLPDAETRRLDDLLGEADKLRRALT